MASTKKGCFCCGLKTGIIFIGLFNIVLSCFNIANGVVVLKNDVPSMEKHIKSHPSQTKHFERMYGFSKDTVKIIEALAKISCVLNGVNIFMAAVFLCLFLLKPVCSTTDQGHETRGIILVWVAWEVTDIVWCIGYTLWIFSKFTKHPLAAGCLLAGLVLNIVVTILFILIAVAYYKAVGESRIPSSAMMPLPPSSIPYGKMEEGKAVSHSCKENIKGVTRALTSFDDAGKHTESKPV